MNELYNKICFTLTDYENKEEKDEKEWNKIFYELLCSVQNKWEEITKEN